MRIRLFISFLSVQEEDGGNKRPELDNDPGLKKYKQHKET